MGQNKKLFYNTSVPYHADIQKYIFVTEGFLYRGLVLFSCLLWYLVKNDCIQFIDVLLQEGVFPNWV